MKTLFIEVRKKSFPELDLNNLPDKIHLLYTIQFKPLALEIKKTLGKRVLACEQVLGCSKIKPKSSLVFIGDGKFHALQIASSTQEEILILPSGEKITREELLMFNNKEKAKISKFYSCNNIGILVSIKPGQNKLKLALSFKKKLESKNKDKNFYLFLADNINLQELENFPINIWLNTACSGLELDSSKILNYEKII